MEIIHNTYAPPRSKHTMNVLYGDRKSENVLQSNDRELLEQMHQAMSVVHGGEYKRRRNPLSA